MDAPTVQELIEELQQVLNPGETIVVLDESEIDAPCEFVALNELLSEMAASA